MKNYNELRSLVSIALISNKKAIGV